MKRILSLDGGGIRGVFSLQVLKKIESIFRVHHQRDDLVLADVYDLFAGTSTGAIIAAGLCWGMSVEEIEHLYLSNGSRMFARSSWFRRFRSKYRSDKLAEVFQQVFTEEAADGQQRPADLGSPAFKKLLLIVMRNATTGSPWPISNNPRSRFNSADHADCNLRIPLWQLLRASTAAPTYFEPQAIRVGGQEHLFIDGAVTPYNNPALVAFLEATMPQYMIDWSVGRDKIHIVSIGTGTTRTRMPDKRARQVTLIDQLSHVTPALIGAATTQQDLLCRIMGDCLHGAAIDLELGDVLTPTVFASEEQKFSYARYDHHLDEAIEDTNLPPLLQAKLDDLRTVPALSKLGQQYAERYVKEEHLYPRDIA